MKYSTIFAIAATALLAASPAYADCPNGKTYTGSVSSNPSVIWGLNAGSINGGVPAAFFDTGTKTDNDCYTAGAISYGTGSAATGELVEDPSDPNKAVYIAPITGVYGENSTAMGNKASVGTTETYTDPGVDGILGDDPSTPADESADDYEATRLVPVNNGTALGAGTSVQHNNSTALGAGAKSSADHQVTLGTADETVTAPGIASQKSKDRQSGPTELVTSDANGNLATDGGATHTAIKQNASDIGAVQADNANQWNAINGNSDRLDTHAKGLAIAMSMPDAWLGEKEKFAVAGNVGGFDSETALGFAAIARIDHTWSLNTKFGADTGFEEYGWTVGARAGW